jgi:hypothetical protein
MKADRLKALIVLIALLDFIGCNKEQTQPAPAPAPAVVTASVANASLTVATDSSNFEVYTAGVAAGKMVTWTYDSGAPFYVTFTNDNPCSNPGDVGAGYPKRYSSSDSAPYTVTCTLANLTPRKKYKYKISLKSVGPTPLITDHCEGCVIDY